MKYLNKDTSKVSNINEKGIYTTKSEIETTLNERTNANVKYISILIQWKK